MNRFHLKEDNRLPNLSVRFSPDITYRIESVNSQNYDKQEALSQWNDYIEWILRYLSNPVIAWDNMNRFHHTSNGETFIEELGMDVGFIIETDNNANQYVYVFYLDLKTDDYGLNESIKKKSIILAEIELRKIISESIRKVLYN